MRFVRTSLAVLAGLTVGMILIAGIEAINGKLYPMPTGVDSQDKEAFAAHIRGLPAEAFGLVLAGWAAGTLAGAWVAARTAQRAPMLHAIIVGSLFLIIGVANMLMIPHPVWMWILALLIFPLCGYAGGRMAARPAAAGSSVTASRG